MLKLEYAIDMNAGKKRVWNIMLEPDTYKEWVQVSWPGSYYEGTWAKGENIKFLMPGHGGTMVNLVECEPFESILARHIAVIKADGTENRNVEASKGWIGSTERYDFKELNGKTTLNILVQTTPEWKDMFNDGWPDALQSLKEICER